MQQRTTVLREANALSSPLPHVCVAFRTCGMFFPVHLMAAMELMEGHLGVRGRIGIETRKVVHRHGLEVEDA